MPINARTTGLYRHSRRTVALTALTLAILLGIVVSQAIGQDQEKISVVYHVSDAEKVGFALNNIRNHIVGAGGPDKVDIVLVAHGPALKALHDIEANDRVRGLFGELRDQGVEFDACGNTMNAQGVELTDLLPGFVRVDQGGVTRIAELQHQGYAYIRP